jgi:hypothetical protein
MVSKEKKIFHYDIFEDNAIDGQRLFGVKLSIDGKVIAKARATSKESRRKSISTPILHFKKKWIRNNIILINYIVFSLVNHLNFLVQCIIIRYTIFTTYFIIKWQF